MKYHCTGRYVTGEEAPSADIFAYSSQEAQLLYERLFSLNPNLQQIGYSFCIISSNQDDGYGYGYGY